MNRLGVVLVAGAFLWSCFHVFRHVTNRVQEPVVIRFSHWQLEGGLREAYAEVARRYMEMHPGVKIEQMPVPGRVYATWIRTATAGGVTPDLMVLGGATDESLVLDYLPLTPWLLKPNPYNRGTPFENMPWRETFLGGLANSSGIETLQDYYSVPVATMTVRMYYNRDLWKELLGDRPPPTSFEEFLQVCEDVRERSKVLGKSISPMAGSRFTANVLMLPLFRSQTQRLWQDLNPMKDLAPPPPNFLNFLPGLATLDDPEIRNGLSMMRDIGKYLQEGFLQLDRDDAILMFGQGRALMLPTGVWDYGSVIEQSRFPIGFFQLPLPTPGSPVYGKSVLGPISEGVGTQGAGFHLSAKSKHPEVAVDFLRYLTSVKGNGLFSSISKWPPSVLGVEMQEDVRAFEPIKEGFPTGFDLSPLMYGSGSLYRLQEQALYTLFDQDGSADQFLTAVRPKFQEAIRDDVNRDIWNRERGVQRGDLVHAAEMMMEPSGGLEKSESGVSRRSRLEQSQNFQEVTAYRMKAQMENRLFPTRRSEASEKKEAE